MSGWCRSWSASPTRLQVPLASLSHAGLLKSVYLTSLPALLADIVAAEVNIKHILRKDPEVAERTIQKAKTVLEKWQGTYLEVRKRIESSGTDHRWEFDRKRLFERTNYMARICEHLENVSIVLGQFRMFLGPELMAVTGDSAGINEVVKRVEGLVLPLEGVPFVIFDRRYKATWDGVMVSFQDKVDDIEAMCKRFVDTAFRQLRSAEGAFDLLLKFQNMQSRDSIKQQLMDKFDAVLAQYGKEVAVRYSVLTSILVNHPTVCLCRPLGRFLTTTRKIPP